MTHADRIYEFLSEGNAINSQIAREQFGIAPKYFYKVIAELETEVDLDVVVENRLKTYSLADNESDWVDVIQPTPHTETKRDRPLTKIFLEIIYSGGVVEPVKFAKQYHTNELYVTVMAANLRKQGHKILSVISENTVITKQGANGMNYIHVLTDPSTVGMKYKLIDQMLVDLQDNKFVSQSKYAAYPLQAAALVHRLRKEGYNIHTVRTPTETFYQLVEE